MTKKETSYWNGAIRGYPDLRDYSDRHELVLPLMKAMGIHGIKQEELPYSVSLIDGFSKVENQGSYGSCTSQAGVGILEYMQRMAYGNNVELSRMFLYNCSKRLLGWTGDTGAYLRATMAAIRMFGVPPERYFPYDGQNMDKEPDGYTFAMAGNFKGITYFRHDAGENTEPACALLSIKKNLAAGIPTMFGFYGFPSFRDGATEGDIPMPGPDESANWSHAVVACGYADGYEIVNKATGLFTKGAIIFRNSWGKNWGHNGYGRLPYDFFLRRYCWDMWSILKAKWIDTGVFGLK